MGVGSLCGSSCAGLVQALEDATEHLKQHAASAGWRGLDVEAGLVAADRLRRISASVEAALLREADRRGAIKSSGARSSADWLAGLTGESPQAAYTKVRVAEAVSERPELGVALHDGSISAEQVRIVHDTAVNTLAASPQVAELLDAARDSDVAGTRRSARQLTWEIADQTPGERFTQQRRKRTCSINDSVAHDGMVELRALLDPVAGAQLKHRLFSVAKGMGKDPSDMARFNQRLADSLVQECTRAGSGSGLSRASVVVTVTLDALMDGLTGTGRIAGGDAIPVGEVRRLAAGHGVIPLVLGGPSEILDLGRRQPFASDAQRTAPHSWLCTGRVSSTAMPTPPWLRYITSRTVVTAVKPTSTTSHPFASDTTTPSTTEPSSSLDDQTAPTRSRPQTVDTTSPRDQSRCAGWAWAVLVAWCPHVASWSAGPADAPTRAFAACTTDGDGTYTILTTPLCSAARIWDTSAVAILNDPVAKFAERGIEPRRSINVGSETPIVIPSLSATHGLDLG